MGGLRDLGATPSVDSERWIRGVSDVMKVEAAACWVGGAGGALLGLPLLLFGGPAWWITGSDFTLGGVALLGLGTATWRLRSRAMHDRRSGILTLVGQILLLAIGTVAIAADRAAPPEQVGSDMAEGSRALISLGGPLLVVAAAALIVILAPRTWRSRRNS